MQAVQVLLFLSAALTASFLDVMCSSWRRSRRRKSLSVVMVVQEKERESRERVHIFYSLSSLSSRRRRILSASPRALPLGQTFHGDVVVVEQQ